MLSRFLLTCVIALLLAASPAQGTENPDQIARGLAGLSPIPDMPGFSGPEFARYGKQVEQSWQTYVARIGTPMTEWGKKELPAKTDATLFYPFSGPDLPTPAFLRPSATHYILIANQRAGEPVAPQKLSAKEASRLFGKYQKAWMKFGQIGFFLTNDLMRDTHPTAKDINPAGILMAFAARLGFTVESAEPISIGSNGELQVVNPADAGSWSSLRLGLRRNDNQQKVVLDYVYMDLSDAALLRHPENVAFIQHSARHPVLLKAASHLPQSPGFTQIRQAIVEGAPYIVQDETGIDYGLLKESFQVSLYGNYTHPHQLFPGSPQRALSKAYKENHDVHPLSFRVGYEKVSGSALMIALRGKNPSSTATPQKASAANSQSLSDRLELQISQSLESYRKRERTVFLSLDNQEAAYRPYLGKLHTALLPSIKAVEAKLPEGKNLVMGLNIRANGTVQNVFLVRGSGDNSADKTALKNFSLPPSLPAQPPELKSNAEIVQVIFRLAKD